MDFAFEHRAHFGSALLRPWLMPCLAQAGRAEMRWALKRKCIRPSAPWRIAPQGQGWHSGWSGLVPGPKCRGGRPWRFDHGSTAPPNRPDKVIEQSPHSYLHSSGPCSDILRPPPLLGPPFRFLRRALDPLYVQRRPGQRCELGRGHAQGVPHDGGARLLEVGCAFAHMISGRSVARSAALQAWLRSLGNGAAAMRVGASGAQISRGDNLCNQTGWWCKCRGVGRGRLL